jgi:hypothetical protein
MKEVPYNGPTPTERSGPEERSRGTLNIPTIRTFKNDVDDHIKENGITQFSIIEAERKREQERSRTREDSHGVSRIGWALFIVLLVFAFLLGTSAYVLLDGKLTKGVSSVSSTTPQAPPETTHSGVIVIHNGPRAETIADVIVVFTKTTLNNGSIRPLTWKFTDASSTEHIATSKELFQRMAPSSQVQLIRTLDDTYESSVASGVPPSGLYRFSIHSYASAFAGMLASEEKIGSELVSFTLPTRKTLPLDLSGRTFRDMLIDSIPVRILQDDGGQTVLCYGFPDRTHLLITANEEVFRSQLQP